MQIQAPVLDHIANIQVIGNSLIMGITIILKITMVSISILTIIITMMLMVCIHMEVSDMLGLGIIIITMKIVNGYIMLLEQHLLKLMFTGLM